MVGAIVVAGLCLDLGVWRQLGQSEVEQFGLPAFGDDDVGRLDVAVNDVLFVRSIQSVGELNGQGQN